MKFVYNFFSLGNFHCNYGVGLNLKKWSRAHKYTREIGAPE